MPRGLGVELVGDDREKAAVSGIDVHASTMLAGERDDVGERVDGAEPRRTERRDDHADTPGGELTLESVEAHAAVSLGRYTHRVDAEHLAHARVRVVSIRRMSDRLTGRDLAAHPERLEVGRRAAPREVAHVVGRVPEHGRELVEHLVLHARRRRTRVDRVVVGIELHRREVRSDSNGMRWLEHLPRVLRVKVRKVVVEAFDQLTEYGLHVVGVDVLALVNIPLAVGVFQALDALDRLR